MRYTSVGDGGARALARSPYLGGLATLDLRSNDGIGPAGRETLRDRFGPAVLL